MNPNWSGISAGILAIAMFPVAYRGAMKLPKGWRVFLTITALVLAVPGVSFAAYYLHLMPERQWYYEFRSLRWSEFTLVLVGAAGGMMASVLPRLLLVVPLLGVGLCVTVPFVKPFMGPLGELKDEWRDGVCMQTTPSTCGAASMATVMSDLGGNTGEEELARAAHSYDRGTEAWYLARAARVRGYDVRFDLGNGFDPDGGLPAVVGVLIGARGHFIAVLGREGEKFVIGDPLVGREVLSLEEMKRRWDFTGFHMRVGTRGEHSGAAEAR